MTHIHSENIREWDHAQPIRVFLDGTELNANMVTESNEEAGYVVMGVPDKDNRIFVDPRTDDVRMVRLEGLVHITFMGKDQSREQALASAFLFQRRKLA